jgi:arginine-tRNA-protein transferase
MKPQPRQIPLYLSAPHPCSYLDGQQANTLFADPEGPMDMPTYSELLRFGFRRSGRMVYAPRCEFCSQCVSVRIPVADFAPTRSQRRVAAANTEVEIVSKAAIYDPRHFALYQRYTRARHCDGEMADASPQEYLGFLRASWSDTRFVELLLDDRLVGVAVTDVAEDGLSAVYTFFEPELPKRSLGTLAILRQIELAQSMEIPYLYLGYWIADSPKMAYKTRFRPIERWIDGQWRRTATS